MKRFALIAVLAAAFVAAPGAAWADNNIGCGLGTQMFEGKDGLVFQLLGTFTNGLVGTQTFGISSNTLGCSRGAVITAEYRVNMFASANMDALVRDMAMGGGESLETLAVLMEIDEPDRAAFYQLTKDNFVSIFPSDSVTVGEMMGTIDTLMAEDDALGRYAQG